jgi:hypothetical protein
MVCSLWAGSTSVSGHGGACPLPLRSPALCVTCARAWLRRVVVSHTRVWEARVRARVRMLAPNVGHSPTPHPSPPPVHAPLGSSTRCPLQPWPLPLSHAGVTNVGSHHAGTLPRWLGGVWVAAGPPSVWLAGRCANPSPQLDFLLPAPPASHPASGQLLALAHMCCVLLMLWVGVGVGPCAEWQPPVLLMATSSPPLSHTPRVPTCKPTHPTFAVQQVRELREEERSESSWFVLPDESDDDVNWSEFTVEIEGPVRACGRVVWWSARANPG